jgi:hypothetical protein
MRTIIAGSRDFVNYDLMNSMMDQVDIWITEVLSGGARGADKLGERWAVHNDIPYELWLADWEKHGKSAGPIRNRQMAQNAEALIAFWDGRSRGTKHMINTARKLGLEVRVFTI